MLRSPIWTAEGGSRTEGNGTEGISSAMLGAEFFLLIEVIEDIRLKSLLALESFFSFFVGFSSLLEMSKLCTEVLRGGPPFLDSLIRRPKDRQLLSDDDRGRLAVGSIDCADEGGLGDVGSVLTGLFRELEVGGRVDFWWSMVMELWCSSSGLVSVGMTRTGFCSCGSRTIRAVT